LSDFDVKLVIFNHIDVCFKKGFNEPNYGTCTVRRVVALAQLWSWGIPFVPAIFSVLRISADFAPAPGSKCTGQRLRFVNPYLCPILGVRAYRAESKSGGRLIIVLPEFDGRGGGPPS
jgi:hypothetical protein